MIGGFEVRRRDGSHVDFSEWRTAKTRDLLRLLVLERGRLVGTDRILQALWPGVDRPHGAASIRTAASRIRVVVDGSCVRRGPGGLAAFGTRSDVEDLDALLAEVRLRRATGDHAGTVRVADVATRLLDGEFYADAFDEDRGGDDSWAVQAHERVAAMQSEIRTLQAESALDVGDLHLAVELARRAILRDPFSQGPHHVLMRALAALGEVDRARRVHDRLQVVLHEDLGGQPFPRTRTVREHIRWALTDLADVGPRTGASPEQEPRQQTASASVAAPVPVPVPVPVPGHLGSLEEHLVRWLRERARGAGTRIQVVCDKAPGEEFPVELTLGSRGTLEVADEPQDGLWPKDA